MLENSCGRASGSQNEEPCLLPRLNELERAQLMAFPAMELFLGRDLGSPGSYQELELARELEFEVGTLIARLNTTRGPSHSKVASVETHYSRVAWDSDGNVSVGAIFTLKDQSDSTLLCDEQRLYSVCGGAVVNLGLANTRQGNLDSFSVVPIFSPEAFNAELDAGLGGTLRELRQRAKDSLILAEEFKYAEFMLALFEPRARLDRFELRGSRGDYQIRCRGGRMEFEIAPRLNLRNGRVEHDVEMGF